MVTQILAEGQRGERELERQEFESEVRVLLRACPTNQADRLIYIRNLVYKALKGGVDLDVFREFCKRVHALVELETVLPRARLVLGRPK